MGQLEGKIAIGQEYVGVWEDIQGGAEDRQKGAGKQ